MAKLAAFRLVEIFASQLPNSWLTVLGYLAGAAAFVAARGARRAVLANLQVALPETSERARRRIALRTFIHGAWGYLELLGMRHKVTPEQLLASYPVLHWERFEQATAEGKGIVLVSAHVGQPLIAGQLIVAHGLTATVIVERLEPPALHSLIAGIRAHFGLRMLTLGASAIREALAALRRGECIGVLCDRDIAGTGAILPFFGVPTRVTTAPAALARRTGAMLVPTAAYRTSLFRGYALIDEPFFVEQTPDPSKDVLAATQRVINSIERFIRACPDQWTVFAEIWPDQSRVQIGTGPPRYSVTIPREGMVHSSIEAAGDT